MPFNELLARRIRKLLDRSGTSYEEKKMFGGLTFMINNKMSCGVSNDDLMVRVVETKYQQMLKRSHVRAMDFTGRPLKGFLFIDPGGIETDKELKEYIDLGIEFVIALPKKKKNA